MDHHADGVDREPENPHFTAITSPDLSNDIVARVAQGDVGAVCIQNILCEATCEGLLAGLDPTRFERYSRKNYPQPIYKVGPVLNEFREQGRIREDYWWRASQAERECREVPYLEMARLACLERVRKSWTGVVRPAAARQRPLFWGILREINQGTLVHWDEVRREYPMGLFDAEPLIQLGYNVFLAVPESGGELSVWRRKWRQSDERFRYKFGYEADVVNDEQSISVSANVGDGIVFDSSNYHAVSPCTGGRRVSIALFLGVTATGEMLLWS